MPAAEGGVVGGAAGYAYSVDLRDFGAYRVVGDLQQPTAESVLDRMKGLGN